MASGAGRLIFNSLLLYWIAFIVTTLLHELAHALMSLGLGGRPVLHHNHVTNEVALGVGAAVAVKLAGPLWSLSQGVIATLALSAFGRRGPLRLLVLWLAVLGYNNFFGYLFTTMFARAGDIGQVAAMLQFSFITRLAISLFGIACQLLVIWHLRRPFLEFAADAAELETAAGRRRVMLRALIVPWLIGSILFSLSSLPSPAWISLIYPISSGMPFIMPWQAAGNPKALAGVRPPDGLASRRWAWEALAIVLALVAFNQFVLRPGIALG